MAAKPIEPANEEMQGFLKEALYVDERGKIRWNGNRPVTHFKSNRDRSAWAGRFANELAGHVSINGAHCVTFIKDGVIITRFLSWIMHAMCTNAEIARFARNEKVASKKQDRLGEVSVDWSAGVNPAIKIMNDCLRG